MSEPLDLPALDDAASLLDDEQPSIGALDVMKRGLRVSPELRAGLGITVVMALTAAIGRLVVPILVQLILDNGVLGELGLMQSVEEFSELVVDVADGAVVGVPGDPDVLFRHRSFSHTDMVVQAL